MTKELLHDFLLEINNLAIGNHGFTELKQMLVPTFGRRAVDETDACAKQAIERLREGSYIRLLDMYTTLSFKEDGTPEIDGSPLAVRGLRSDLELNGDMSVLRRLHSELFAESKKTEEEISAEEAEAAPAEDDREVFDGDRDAQAQPLKPKRRGRRKKTESGE